MKKLLTLLALATPLLSCSQGPSTGLVLNFGGIVSFILFVGIALLIFLVLRSILLWYWKVETILENQETTNQLLEDNNELLYEFIEYMKNKDAKDNN